MTQITYIKSTLAGETQIGPISKQEFAAAIRAGHVKPKTKVYLGNKTMENTELRVE